MLEEIAKIASEKAIEIAIQETHKFKEDHMEIEISDAMREIVKERAVSQMTFHLNSFKATDGSEADLTDQFEAWFSGNQEDELRKSCKRCLEEEAAKLGDGNDENASFLEKYMKKHGMSI